MQPAVKRALATKGPALIEVLVDRELGRGGTSTAPVSWGILEFAGQSSQQPWESVLDEMIAAGYVGTELGPYGFLPTDPNALKAALAARGLQLLSAFVPVQLSDWSAHEAGLAACAKRSARREPGNMSS